MSRIKRVILYFFAINHLFLFSQNKLKVDTIFVDSIPKKILYDNKIYKLNAGFFALNGGYYISNNLTTTMKGINFNFNFHILKEWYAQVGLIRLKDEQSFQFPEKKDVSVSYFNLLFSPFVIKTENIHFAFILNPVGVSYGGGYKDETYHYKGIIAQDSTETIQNNYFGLNFYSTVQCIYKFKYDLGIGLGAYAEFSTNNTLIAGLNISLYFSAAFKGYQTKPAWYYKKNPDKD